MAETVTRAKNILKTVLGQVPLTAELYWLMRGSDKTLISRFSLKKLDQHMAEEVEQASALMMAAKAGGRKYSSSRLCITGSKMPL
jgi:hypothetical protein